MILGGNSQTEAVGILLITYRGGADRQPIAWVRLADFTSLQRKVEDLADRTRKAQAIRHQIAELRRQGVTDQELAGHGIDVALFERLATEQSPWLIISYRILRHETLGVDYLRIARAHQLPVHTITNVELVQRRTAEIW